MAQQLQAPKPCSDLSPSKAPAATVKIYYLHSRMAGPLPGWDRHLARIRAMGFSHVCLPPPFAPGRNGDAFLTDRHDAADPVLGIDGTAADAIATDSAMATATRTAAARGLLGRPWNNWRPQL